MLNPQSEHYGEYYFRQCASILPVSGHLPASDHHSRMDTWRSRLRRRFAELKATEGLTQEGLAERVGVTQGTVAHWLNGRRTPDTLSTFEALAKALSVHPAWLIYGIEVDDGANEAVRKLNSLPPARRDAIITLILDR